MKIVRLPFWDGTAGPWADYRLIRAMTLAFNLTACGRFALTGNVVLYLAEKIRFAEFQSVVPDNVVRSRDAKLTILDRTGRSPFPVCSGEREAPEPTTAS